MAGSGGYTRPYRAHVLPRHTARGEKGVLKVHANILTDSMSTKIQPCYSGSAPGRVLAINNSCVHYKHNPDGYLLLTSRTAASVSSMWDALVVADRCMWPMRKYGTLGNRPPATTTPRDETRGNRLAAVMPSGRRTAVRVWACVQGVGRGGGEIQGMAVQGLQLSSGHALRQAHSGWNVGL